MGLTLQLLISAGTFLAGIAAAVPVVQNIFPGDNPSASSIQPSYGMNDKFLIMSPAVIDMCTAFEGSGQIPDSHELWVFEKDEDGEYWTKGRALPDASGNTWRTLRVEIGSSADQAGRAYLIVAAIMGRESGDYLRYLHDQQHLSVAPMLPPGAKEVASKSVGRRPGTTSC
jgi:hypothetical protein